jgi:hypothetical protein
MSIKIKIEELRQHFPRLTFPSLNFIRDCVKQDLTFYCGNRMESEVTLLACSDVHTYKELGQQINVYESEAVRILSYRSISTGCQLFEIKQVVMHAFLGATAQLFTFKYSNEYIPENNPISTLRLGPTSFGPEFHRSI